MIQVLHDLSGGDGTTIDGCRVLDVLSRVPGVGVRDSCGVPQYCSNAATMTVKVSKVVTCTHACDFQQF